VWARRSDKKKKKKRRGRSFTGRATPKKHIIIFEN
jgi:hypothetical protein